MTFRLSAPAEADIQTIARHIAADNPSAARRWVDDLYRHFSTIGTMPGIGAPRFDIRPNLRILPVGAYLILYRHVDECAEIVRVIHGARQWQDLL